MWVSQVQNNGRHAISSHACAMICTRSSSSVSRRTRPTFSALPQHLTEPESQKAAAQPPPPLSTQRRGIVSVWLSRWVSAGTKSKRDTEGRNERDEYMYILTVIQSTRWLLISDCNMSGCTHFLISNWHRFAIVLAGVALGHSHYRQNWPPPETYKQLFIIAKVNSLKNT